MLFGGLIQAGPLDDTWLFTGTDWQRYSVGAMLSPRWDAVAAFDPNRRAIGMVGGLLGASATGDYWEFRADGWRLSAELSIAPRALHSVAALPSGLVVMGGRYTTNGLVTDTQNVSVTETFRIGEETCHPAAPDIDEDGLIGCTATAARDPDCWGYCTPLCPPWTKRGTLGWPAVCEGTPRCGDGIFQPELEPGRCLQDCS